MIKEIRDEIIKLVKTNGTISVSDIQKINNSNRSTIYRFLKKLVEENILEIEKKGIYKYKTNIKEYLEQPFFKRKNVKYNHDFLRTYIPNKSSFFNKKQNKILQQAVNKINLDALFFENNKRLLELMLVDMSFSSSSLEGNTYSYLDTEILINYNEIAKDKAKDETQMILNHKKTLEYIIFYKKKLIYNGKTFREVHSMLGEKLLNGEYLGKFREHKVEIGASTYETIDNVHQLTEEFELFTQKLSKIKNPFEQSIFILTFISYFQLFTDCNKRVSRMMAIVPLIKNNLPLISLLGVEKKDYITAILAIYELNDVSLLAKIYAENYVQNMHRYLP